MPTPAQLTSPPMGSRPAPGILDDDGAILPEAFAGWIATLRAAGWSVARIARELGSDERTVWYWTCGRYTPTKAVRRLAWRALWGPLEAEVNGHTQARPAALRAAQGHRKRKGGSEAVKPEPGALPRPGEGSHAVSLPSASSPAPVEVDWEAAAAEAGMTPDDLREMVRKATEGK